jgi:RNA polymerase sigma-70 factor (ECF subfamily)
MKSSRDLTARLRAAIQRRGNSREDAEDLVQDAFLRFEQQPDKTGVREPDKFIARTAFNLSVDARRRRLRSPISGADFDGLEFPDRSPDPSEVYRTRERLRRLSEGLRSLSPRSRRILLAQRLEGLTYPEIARREGISVSAVEKHIARAMAFLTDWMDGW